MEQKIGESFYEELERRLFVSRENYAEDRLSSEERELEQRR